MSINGYNSPYSSFPSNSYPSGLGSSSSVSGNAGGSDVKFSNGYTSSSESAGSGEKKPGGVGGFFTGIWNGAKNAVKSLATPKGLLMAGAGLAACIAFPVAAPLVLGSFALAAGGFKMYSAAKNHDAEGVGEGFFTAGAGAAGVWGGAVGATRAGSINDLSTAAKGSGAAAEGSGAAAEGSGAATEGTKAGGFMSWLKGKFSSSSKPASGEPPASVPPAPQIPGQNGTAAPSHHASSTAAPAETAVPEAALPAPGRTVPGEFPGSPTIPAEPAAARSMPGAFPGSPTIPGENLAATPAESTGAAAEGAGTAAEGSGAAAEGSGAATEGAKAGGFMSWLKGKFSSSSKPAPAAEGAAATEGKPAMFQAARDRYTNAYQYIKNPFTGPMPEGASAPGIFARTGQVLTGRAPGVSVGQPLWSLPPTTAISGNGIPQYQQN